ncbi:uncharacterized protein LOC126843752 isoform X1 [Adelges cooleyi]|uniref:uncharacterized protein LOC126843752 isoform X1 n=1 Tax=Adelges cooleyi TaxID=133065 RepID=UPI00217F60AB|nr:uncharacterized protein LOC126843752 isoform X1 [Adelges cooleyi]XP_050437443.1 uncharacterized protein LOC126843752 isoform X1 [Adelges cooleyi]XP_050437444.1 uncharacterized protein LOC126843752 isoform X1 [Adelges cooleyi]
MMGIRQPVVKDIVSAFESSQNQSWSMFCNKLGGIPDKDYKRKDFLKSENPIELSEEDVPVFGLIPRLENLVLVSCTKCSMVVKRDCIHFHYNRRHNNSQNDEFTLEQFMIPNLKANKQKRQKFNGRKIKGKKVVDCHSEDSAVQDINTEFNQLDFMRLPDLKPDNNEISYDNECSMDMPITIIKTYDPNTDCGVLDWAFKPCTQSLARCIDHKIKERMAVTGRDKDFDQLLAESLGVTTETKFNYNNIYSNFINDENNDEYLSKFIPVSSNTRIINNTLTQTTFDDFKVEYDDDRLWNFEAIPKYDTGSVYSPDGKYEDLPSSLMSYSSIEKSSKVTSDCETSFKPTTPEQKNKYLIPFYTGRQYVQNAHFNHSEVNGLIYMDKKHLMCKARLKESLDIKKQSSKKRYKFSQKNNLEIKMKNLLNRPAGGQVFADKENRNRWITSYEGFKKIKRVEFVMRKIPHSDDSDNNDVDK